MTKAKQLGITEFPYREYDELGRETYFEYRNEYWTKKEYDKFNNQIYRIDSHGDYEKCVYDENNNLIFLQNSFGYWGKYEYDENNNLICSLDSDGLSFFRYFKGNKMIKEIHENVEYHLRNYKLEKLLK